MSRARATVALAAATLTLTLGTSLPAHAQEFGVQSCVADSGRFSSQAFKQFATRRMKIRRACNPTGNGVRGLVTANVQRGGYVRRGGRAIVTLNAPPGTVFRSFRWSGATRRVDCRYALQMWAQGPNVPTVPIKNVRANRKCPRKGKAQAAHFRGLPTPRRYAIPGTTRIVQRAICVGSRRRKACSLRGLNYIQTFAAQARVIDLLDPSVQITGGGLVSGRWVNGTQDVTFNALDNVGVRAEKATLPGLEANQARPCDQSGPSPARAAQVD